MSLYRLCIVLLVLCGISENGSGKSLSAREVPQTESQTERQARRFYLDSENGNDAAEGLSPTQAWKTIRRLNREKLVPGDAVLFKRGGLWREQLKPQSGEPGKPIVYDAYGEGEMPILQGSEPRNRAEDWRSCGKNLWETLPVKPVLGKKVFANLSEPWRVHQEKPAEVRLDNQSRDGKTLVRLTVQKPGESPSHIQLIGPTLPLGELGEAAMLKIRARCSKPLTVPSVVLRNPGSPWNDFFRAGRGPAITEKWEDVDIFLTRTGLSEKGQLVFYVGGAVAEDSVLEFEIPALHAAALPEDRKPLALDVGNIVFDHGKQVGFKRWGLDELKEADDFWHDLPNDRVVLYSEKNPGKLYDSVELCLKRNIVDHGGVRDCVIRNLVLRYGAAHGVGGQGAKRVVIENCDIYYIGGGHLYTRDGRPTRYGNGIEWWCEAEDCLVRRCRLWEIYDVAFSPQGNAENKTIKNILIRDCTIRNCEQSFEYWRTGEGAVTENVVFEHNTCVDAGFGWSHRQRPDKRGTHFLSYNVTVKTDIVLRNNIFYRGENDLISMFCDWRDGVRLHNNLWFQPKGKVFLSMRGQSVFQAGEFAKYQDEYGMEKDSVFAEPVFVGAADRDYRLAPESPGLRAATDGGAVGRRDFSPVE